jgi:hypothetical protein
MDRAELSLEVDFLTAVLALEAACFDFAADTFFLALLRDFDCLESSFRALLSVDFALVDAETARSFAGLGATILYAFRTAFFLALAVAIYCSLKKHKS